MRNLVVGLFFLVTFYSFAQTDSLKKDSTKATVVADTLTQKDSIAVINAAVKPEKKKEEDSIFAYPAIVKEDTIFWIHAKKGVGSWRAEHFNVELSKLQEEGLFHLDSLKFVEKEDVIMIHHGDVHLITITQADAAYQNSSVYDLARLYKENIEKAFAEEHVEKSFREKLISWIWIGVVIVALFFSVKFLNRLFRKLAKDIIPRKLNHKIKHGIKIKEVEVITAERLKVIITLGVKWLQKLLALFFIYIAIMVMVKLFPGTEKITDQILGYLLTPLKSIGGFLVEFIPNMFRIFIIVMITKYFVRFLKFIAEEIERGKLEVGGFYSDWAGPTYKIIRFLVYVFSAVMIFPYLPGSDSPAFKGISIFLGVLFSLGSSSAISNLVGGIVITYMRPFKMQDRVIIGTTEGYVIDKNLLVTKLRTIKNEEVTIPNSIVLNSHIKNYHANHVNAPLIIHLTVTIGYDVPWKKVHELLINAAKKTKDILDDPAPFVLQTSLDDNYVSYQINGYIENINKMERICSLLNGHIQDEFNTANVEIMSPAYSAIRDGNESTIPSPNLPEGYEAPKFRIGIIDKLFK